MKSQLGRSSRVSKVLISVLAGAWLTLGGVLTAAPAVAAQTGTVVSQCKGTLKKVHNLDGARVEVWYSSANNGTNCAMIYDNAPGANYLSINIRRSDRNFGSSDSGVYSYYAGGVVVTGTNGRCVEVTATVALDRNQYGWLTTTQNYGPYLCG